MIEGDAYLAARPQKSRMHRLFNSDGRIFILAMDHGISLDVLPFLNDPGEVILVAKASGVDTFITSYGIAKNYSKQFGQSGVIVRVDGGATKLSTGAGYSNELLSVEEILKIGADGAVCMGFPGSQYEDASLGNLVKFISQADKWDIPLCAEMLPCNWDSNEWTKDRLIFVSRLAAELGADLIKTQYTGDKESFKQLVEGCYRPVVVLGGPGNGSEKALLQTIRDSLDAGGKGAAIGRSIWMHSDPAGYCRAISRLIHDDASVEEAMREFEVSPQ